MQENPKESSDAQLLERVHKGDSGALGLLYIRYSARVYDLALHFQEMKRSRRYHPECFLTSVGAA